MLDKFDGELLRGAHHIDAGRGASATLLREEIEMGADAHMQPISAKDRFGGYSDIRLAR
jgi:hypothetical protein